MSHIVKRAGHSELYDERKLYASIYASCLAVRESDHMAEMIAAQVCKEIGEWLKHKPEVTSHDIRTHSAIHLKSYSDDAAWIYKHHRSIS